MVNCLFSWLTIGSGISWFATQRLVSFTASSALAIPAPVKYCCGKSESIMLLQDQTWVSASLLHSSQTLAFSSIGLVAVD